jgi:hypothetical protein
MTRNTKLWLLWGLVTLAGIAVFIGLMVYGGNRSVLLIGRTTDGHHQIELACNTCHTSPFGGTEALQAACEGCHAAELKRAKDTHPASKFRDPRNADRLEKLDAMRCVTCHREHKAEITGPMGVTLPMDYCFRCHEGLGKERPSHKDVAFDTCASAGCHNYHDNTALYENFLEKHIADPAHRTEQRVPLRIPTPAAGGAPPAPAKPPLAAHHADAPADRLNDPKAVADWAETGHARAGINCTGCHGGARAATGMTPSVWTDRPAMSACTSCHTGEAQTLTEGKHGMRLRPGLKVAHAGLFGLLSDEAPGPMRPERARLPMKGTARGTELTCNTCHTPHRFDTRRAQVESCLGCHDDRHSKAYRQSPHYRLWQGEIAGTAPPGTGVSCATCHMPRLKQEDPDSGLDVVIATHNQNDNLRPNEKMARNVCLDCHGLGFTLDSLADRALIESNFSGSPAVHVESIDWVVRRIKARGVLK